MLLARQTFWAKDSVCNDNMSAENICQYIFIEDTDETMSRQAQFTAIVLVTLKRACVVLPIMQKLSCVQQ